MADLTSGTLGGLDSGVNLGQNFNKTSPSSLFGTRNMAFYGVYLAPYQQGTTAVPFEITFLGSTYSYLYVGTNGYITFGDHTNNYDFNDDPTMNGADLPAILVSENNNSYQYVYSKTTGDAYNNTRRYTVRYEGTGTTGGENYAPNMIWEVTFYEELPGIVDLVVIDDARNRYGAGVSGVTDGTNWVDDYFEGHFAGWGKGSFRIDTTDGSTAKVTPGPAVEQGMLGMQIEHQFNHDTAGSTNNHEEDDDYVQVYGCVWNGSDYSNAVRALQQVVELYYIGQPILGMGIEFVIAIADDTVSYDQAVTALESVWGPVNDAFYFAPMTVGPESIYFGP